MEHALSRRRRKKSFVSPTAKPSRILVIDIGGTKIKVLASGHTEPRKISSGKKTTPATLVEGVKKITADWEYDAIALGFPGLVGPNGPCSEPGNLGPGWVGFDFAAAFGCPVRIMNDAAMQALGSYDGGRMLFLGLGTGLGSAFIAEHMVLALELGALPHTDGGMLSDAIGKKGLGRLGKKKWAEAVKAAVQCLSMAFVADYVVLGGGNAKKLKDLLPGTRLGHNLTAFRGGLRLWNIEDAPTQLGHHAPPTPAGPPAEWRMI